MTLGEWNELLEHDPLERIASALERLVSLVEEAVK